MNFTCECSLSDLKSIIFMLKLECFHKLKNFKSRKRGVFSLVVFQWQCLSSPEVVMKSILKSLKHLADTDDVGATYDIHKISEDKRFIRIFTFTWAEWLDVIEISIGPDTVQK
ncbi:hypothetical protein KUTeg_009626 [Tegillarca granosa]|uniref:Uncharacterized protein n=1 Tax=Tegillarca granosa TaxID=220873 RepID=A0ABQ9F9I7_TEGGR|nr:hypothetical protein KUTeg_009626 [Tegillarca granosa]